MANSQNSSKSELEFMYVLISLLFSLFVTLTYEKSLIVSMQLLLLTFLGLIVLKYNGIFKLLIGYVSIIPIFNILISLLSTKSSFLYSTYLFLDKLNIGFTLQITRLMFLFLIVLLLFLSLATKDKNYIKLPAFIRNIFVVGSFLAPIILLTVGKAI